MYKNRCKGEGEEGEEEGEEGKKIGMNLLKSPFLKIGKIVYTKKKSNLQVKNTDHIEIPYILTKQKLNFWPKFPFRANQKNLLLHEKSNFISQNTDRMENPRISTK